VYISTVFVVVDCPSNVRYVYTSHVFSGIFHHLGGIALCLNLRRYQRYIYDPLIGGAKLLRALDSAAFFSSFTYVWCPVLPFVHEIWNSHSIKWCLFQLVFQIASSRDVANFCGYGKSV